MAATSTEAYRRFDEPPPAYSERDDLPNGTSQRNGARGNSRPKTDEHLAYQMFASIPSFIQAAGSFAKYAFMWLFYKGLFGLLLLTPIGPIWLLYQKGLDILTYIPIAIEFAKDLGAIAKKCYDDAINKTGYMDSKQLKRDLRAALLRLLGYEYEKREEAEMKDDDEDEKEDLRWDSTSKERFRDTVVYTITLGNFPTYLKNRGIVPPTRESHRTRQASKSRMASFILCCVGMAYYIVAAKFLFKNVHAIKKVDPTTSDDDLKRKSSNASSKSNNGNGETTQKGFNWRYLYATVVIAFGIWWVFSSHQHPEAHPYLNFFLNMLLSPFTYTIGNALSFVGWSWRKFFAVCFWFPSLILGLGSSSSEHQSTPHQNSH